MHDEPTPRPPGPDPELQERRTRKACGCGGPCFYCDDPLPGRHDHDHFPIPFRHGGRLTVPACRRCHTLKDRVPIERWSPAGQDAGAEGLSRSATVLLAVIVGVMQGDADYGDDLDDLDELGAAVVRVCRECSTAEARITVATAVLAYLDLLKDRQAPVSGYPVEGEAG